MGTGTAQISTKPFQTQQSEELCQYIEVIVIAAQKYISHTHTDTCQALCCCAVCGPASGASQHKGVRDVPSHNNKAFGWGSLGFLEELILLAFDTF